MSGTAKKDQPPKTDAELVRDQDRRIESLESSDAVRMGKWVLSTQDGTENLIASFEDGGSAVVAKVPVEGTGADDVTEKAEVPVIVKYTPPRANIRRTSNAVVATGTDTLVTWEAVDYSNGAITVAAGSDSITIGETGIYDVNFEWQWAANATGTRSITLLLNGSSVATNAIAESAITPTAAGQSAQVLATQRSFNNGDVLRCNVFQSSGGNLGGGAPYFGGISGRFVITLAQAIPILDSGQPPSPTPIQGG